MSCQISYNYPTLEDVWEDIEKIIIELFHTDEYSISQLMTLSSLVTQYVRIWNWRFHQDKFDKLHLHQRMIILLDYLVKEVNERLQNVNRKAILKLYILQWKRFERSTNALNRAYIVRNDYIQEIEPINVYRIALSAWTSIIKVNNNMILQNALDMINLERNNEVINRSLIFDFIDIYVKLGFGEEYLYKENFESHFLTHTENFYSRQSLEFIEKYSKSELFIYKYIEYVKLCLKNENARLYVYLLQSTSTSLITCCEKVLIQQKLNLFKTKFHDLLKSGKNDELTNFYSKIYSLCIHQNEVLIATLEEYIREEINNDNEKIHLLSTCSNQDNNFDHETYFECIYDVYTKYKKLISTCFNNDEGFMKALSNCVEQLFQTCNQLSEIMAKYCDVLLKDLSKNEAKQDVRDTFKRVIEICKHIENKYVFMKIYKQKLITRLIVLSSPNLNIEKFDLGTKSCG